MRFTLAFASLIAAAFAANPNSFNIPPSGNYLLTAGQPTTFTWSNPTQGTVTLLLRTGANSDLKTVATIASSIANIGSYTYTPPTDTPEGANYAIEIVDDADPSIVNYTGQFVIQSNVKAVASSGGATSLVTATTGSAASAATTGATTTAGSTTAASTTGSSSSGSSSGASSSTMATSASAASKTSASATSSSTATVPSTNAAAEGIKAGSGLLAVALAFAVAM